MQIDTQWIAGDMLLAALGALAFLVSAITQATKNLPLLRRLPTDLQALLTALLLTMLAMAGHAAHSGLRPAWYALAGGAVFALLGGFLAIYGWQTFFSLWQRFLPPRAKEARDDA